MPMVDLKREKKESGSLLAQGVEPSEPDYPYGLSLHLDGETLDKLNLGESLKVGDEVRFTAVGYVRSLSASQYEEGGKTEKQKSSEIQITAMDMGDQPSAPASKLYG